MQWESALAIYLLFWVLSGFLVLPFGVKPVNEAGEVRIPGQADSAPVEFRLGRMLLRATITSVVLFGLFWLNYVFGWLTVDMLDFYN